MNISTKLLKMPLNANGKVYMSDIKKHFNNVYEFQELLTELRRKYGKGKGKRKYI